MNKKQTAKEIIMGLHGIAISYNPLDCALPTWDKDQYAKMEALVLSKLDHDHLPDDGKMVEAGPTLSGEDLICPATNKPCEEKLCMMPDDKCEKLAEPIEEDLKKRMETSKHTFGAMCSELPASFYKYHSGEKEFQEIQLKGLGIPDQSFFEQRINTVIAMAWEREVLRKQNETLKEQNAGLRDENQTLSDVNKEAMNRVRELEWEGRKAFLKEYARRLGVENKTLESRVKELEPKPTLSDDELKKKAEEIANRILAPVWLSVIDWQRVLSAMIEMYKLK